MRNKSTFLWYMRYFPFYQWYSAESKGKLDKHSSISTLEWKVGRFACMYDNYYQYKIPEETNRRPSLMGPTFIVALKVGASECTQQANAPSQNMPERVKTHTKTRPTAANFFPTPHPKCPMKFRMTLSRLLIVQLICLPPILFDWLRPRLGSRCIQLKQLVR